MPIQTISPAQLSQRLGHAQPLCLLDVRTPAEFAQLHAAGATNLPLADLQAESPLPETDGSLVLLCQSGARARAAAQLLASRGERRDLLILQGGTPAWQEAGLPVIHGKTQGWSLERQVRLVVGCLVLLSVLLNRMGLESAIYLAAFVSVGLIVASLTNTCAMGLLLAQMPWNRRKV